MSPEEHRERHIELHKCLDELVADYISNTRNSLSKATILDLMRWSAEQLTVNKPPGVIH